MQGSCGPGDTGLLAVETFQNASYNAHNSEELQNVEMNLQELKLWKEFRAVNTEMIITKLGRNMFPVISVEVSGLDPTAHYFILMEVCLNSPRRYKFVGSEWKAAGKAEPQMPPGARIFVHQNSPATGAQWMSESIKMRTAKLTNSSANQKKHVVLTSMHKYIPHIHVVKTSDKEALFKSPSATFMFPETEFIAVTAYQNEKVTQLKIDNNPFAKGFRENGLSQVKRKRNETASKRKRHCNTRNSVLPENKTPPSPSPEIEVSKFHEPSTTPERVPLVHHDHNDSSPIPFLDSRVEDPLSAITNININTNTIQYPHAAVYPNYLHHQRLQEQLWRFPHLLPPTPPLPLSPLSHFLLPIHYQFLPCLHPHYRHLSHSYLTDLNPQPFDYSLRES